MFAFEIFCAKLKSNVGIVDNPGLCKYLFLRTYITFQQEMYIYVVLALRVFILLLIAVSCTTDRSIFLRLQPRLALNNLLVTFWVLNRINRLDFRTLSVLIFLMHVLCQIDQYLADQMRSSTENMVKLLHAEVAERVDTQAWTGGKVMAENANSNGGRKGGCRDGD